MRSVCSPISETVPAYAVIPWHFLYFLPDPHGQGAFRGTFPLTA